MSRQYVPWPNFPLDRHCASWNIHPGQGPYRWTQKPNPTGEGVIQPGDGDPEPGQIKFRLICGKGGGKRVELKPVDSEANQGKLPGMVSVATQGMELETVWIYRPREGPPRHRPCNSRSTKGENRTEGDMLSPTPNQDKRGTSLPSRMARIGEPLPRKRAALRTKPSTRYRLHGPHQ